MSKNLTKLSKFLAVVLRHQPGDFGLALDNQGFTDLKKVWAIIQDKYGDAYVLSDLERVVEGDDRGKKRYEISGDRIRAMYGHSKPEVQYPEVEPPGILYHGTNRVAMKSIRKNGLESCARQYVHMTTNPDNATVVAKRRTESPVMLVIRATEAHESGIVFHQAEAEHYLAKAIPASFIDFPD